MTSSLTEHRQKDAQRVAAGYKAAIHNPNVSDEAKQQAKVKLREMGEDVDSLPVQTHESGPVEADLENPHVIAGYKGTLSNPHTSPEAKKHAEEILNVAGIHERNPDHSDEQHLVRVLAGYKAALHNPRVSEEAKQHAREYLKEYGIED